MAKWLLCCMAWLEIARETVQEWALALSLHIGLKE